MYKSVHISKPLRACGPTTWVCVAAAATLAGCAGQTTGGGDAAARIGQLRALEAEVSEEVEALQGQRIARAADLPVGGSALYEGVMSMSAPTSAADGAHQILYGHAELDAVFQGRGTTLTGQATGFRNLDDAFFPGTLSIEGGGTGRPGASVIESGFVIGGQVSGTLTTPDDETLTLDANITGDAFGANAEVISATIFGTSAVEDDAGNGTSSTLFGALLLAHDGITSDPTD